MAAPRKVGKRWKMEVRRKGVHKYATFATKAEAVAWGKETERHILGGAVEYSKDTTFEYAAKRYLDEVSSKKKGFRWEKVRITKFLNDGLGRYSLFETPSKFWKNWMAGRLTEVAPSSVNRELNLVSGIFEHAKELELVDVNPVRGIKRPKEPKHRERLISESELEAITGHLGMDVNKSSGQVSIALLIAIETGMRRSELLKLTRDNIDLDLQVVQLGDTKNGDRRDVPLSTRACELFSLLGDDVFTLSPDTLSQLFLRACKALNIKDLRFHDSRHTAVVQLARKLDVLDLARMIGHRDLKSLMIYYNEPASEIAKRLG